ncbi:PspC domain-containing protein [Flavobacterium sp. NG2]|uniref:PspC domain-containing protein n=1 Tax=Flavobacterium sp. NG2 TaxID=3097547 RepID=UPI002A7F3FF5|nr:PspC domain-containing protein [Flavobacterium sp. NG2]WPR71179.1 PspC domain-containing protein [Flavobacterium sp. NG2]
MNKTVNINLGGMIFYMDEDAYLKLTRYFDAIKRSLNNSEGQDEIIKDIEMRIAELFQERQTAHKQIVGLTDIDAIIAIMGQPEDYIIEDESTANTTHSHTNQIHNKKLYRDKDNGMLGGVAAGLGHYFGIEALWIRIVLILLVFGGFGVGIIAYIILWVIAPKAVTTTEKLEMTGEPVNISNIEKKVREEFDNVSNKIKNADYDKYGNKIKDSTGKLTNSLNQLIISLFKIFAQFLGILFIIIGLATLLALFIGVFTLGTNTFIEFPWQSLIEAGNFTDYPIWTFGILMFLAIGIPFFFLTLLGFKLLAPQSKSIGNIFKYTLIATWILALAFLITIGVKQVSAFANDGSSIQKHSLLFHPTDTLSIKFKHNPFYSNNITDYSSFKIMQDSTNADILYSNNVNFKIKSTENNKGYIQIKKGAKGKTIAEARMKAKEIQYHFKTQGNQLIFDNYLVTDLENKFRNQEVEITIYLPEGTVFKVESSARNYDHSDNDYFNLHYSSEDYLYKVTPSKIKCLNCPEEENEYDDIENTTITIDKDGVLIEKDSSVLSKKERRLLKIDKKGIIIRTQ